MTSKQPANAPLIVTVGAISVMLFVVIMFGIEAWFRYEERLEVDAKWASSPNFSLINLRKAQLDRINTASVDPKTGTRAIPIADAMRTLVQTGGKLPSTQPAKQN